MRFLCIAVSAALLLSGCSTVRTVRPATHPKAPAFGGVTAGDRISLVLVDGSRATVVVGTIEGDTLVSSSGARYHRNEISQFSMKVHSRQRTAVLAIGLAAGAVALAVLIAAGSALGSLAGGL